jgi:hypothetical protein
MEENQREVEEKVGRLAVAHQQNTERVARQNNELMAKLLEKDVNQRKLEEKIQRMAKEKDKQIERLAVDCQRVMHEVRQKMLKLEKERTRVVGRMTELEHGLNPLKNKASAASVRKLRDGIQTLERSAITRTGVHSCWLRESWKTVLVSYSGTRTPPVTHSQNSTTIFRSLPLRLLCLSFRTTRETIASG